MPNHYDTLGIDRAADGSAIKAAWKRVAKELHPDRNPAPDAAAAFRQAAAAYEVLSDPAARAIYDASLNRPRGRIDIPPARSWRTPMRAARWRGPMLRPEEYPNERYRPRENDAHIASAQGMAAVVLSLPIAMLMGTIAAGFPPAGLLCLVVLVVMLVRKEIDLRGGGIDRAVAVLLAAGILGGIVGAVVMFW